MYGKYILFGDTKICKKYIENITPVLDPSFTYFVDEDNIAGLLGEWHEIHKSNRGKNAIFILDPDDWNILRKMKEFKIIMNNGKNYNLWVFLVLPYEIEFPPVIRSQISAIVNLS